MPVSRLVYDYPSVRIEQKAIGFTYEATLNPKTMEMSGTWKQGKDSGPFTMKLNALADKFPEPMADGDYTPRKDSDVQGFWKGTLKVEKTTLRVDLKIAERADGTFRVTGDSPDQGGSDIEATAVTYHRPTLKVEFGGIMGSYEGTVDESDRVITGNLVSNGHTLPLNLERAKPETAAALDPAIEAQKDYSHTSPNDLQGHWQGTLDVKQSGVKLRLAVNIAKLPDGKFSASMVSLDQGGAEIPANTIQYRSAQCAPGMECHRRLLSTENLKTAKSPAPGGRVVERSRWCWKGTGHNDLANHPIGEMEFDFLSDLAGWRRYISGKRRTLEHDLMKNDSLFQSNEQIRGFTLIELLVVIAILGILSALLLPVLSKAKNRASQVTDLNNLKELTTAINLYCSDHDDIIPWPNWDGGNYARQGWLYKADLSIAASGGIQGGDRTVLDRLAQPQSLPLPDGQTDGLG